MDNEELIAAVFKRTAVWDKHDKFYFNRSVIKKCWKEIASEMNEDENKVRKKWKYLRDQFGVEFGKTPSTRSGDSGETSKWPYFQSLMFLKDIVKPRMSTRNSEFRSETDLGLDTPLETNDDQIQVIPDTANVKIEFCEEDSMVVDVESAPHILPRTSTTPSFTRGIKRHLKNNKKYLKQKQKRSDSTDDHIHFFKSILPFVRQIPRSRILNFRSRVQNLLEEYTSTNPQENLPSPTTPQSFISVSSPSSYNSSDQ